MTDIQREERTSGSSPPVVKECKRALAFEEHEPHTWHKDRDTYHQFPLHCGGILPVDQQPPCQFYIAPEQPICGKPAPATIRVRNALVDAVVDVCITHKSVYNHRSASRRQGRLEQNQPKSA